MLNHNRFFAHTRAWCIILLCCIIFSSLSFAGPGDFNLDGVFEAALDLPRILFLLKRDPNGEPIKYQGEFELNWAFLDTGASGILLSKETKDLLEISLEPDAEYADVGIGGIEFFDVSEPLYIGTNDFNDPDPCDPNRYPLMGHWRFQIKQVYAGEWPNEPLDVLGMPVMAGKTVVFYPGATNDLEYFWADIKEPDSPEIPAVDFNVPIRFEKYISPTDPLNTPPLPVLAYNPVIDNVQIEYDSNSATGTFLFDTGGTISLMSGLKAAELGLTEPNGTPVKSPDFIVPITGVGGEDVNIPGYQIDKLAVPTLNGYKLIYNNARIGVSNIGVYDEDLEEIIIIDGVFGSNFLCASAKLAETLPEDLAETPFERIVFDTTKGLLGFDVNDVYPLPNWCDIHHPPSEADLTGDCEVKFDDLEIFADKWLFTDCGQSNDYCEGADINSDSNVDFSDYASFANQWNVNPYVSTCGDKDNPWPVGDFNRDCSVDFRDLQILTEEWLDECNRLNWKCRGADFDSDNIVELEDYSHFATRW